MKSITFGFLCSLMLISIGCSDNIIGGGPISERPNNEMDLPDLIAEFGAAQTKTYVTDNKYQYWTEDDQISVFYGNTSRSKYEFSGQTGEKAGTFSCLESVEGEYSVLNHIYAVYPFGNETSISNEGEISLSMPSTQNYALNSFGVNANTMIAITENVESNKLSFKNACGFLKMKLYNTDGATLQSLEIKGNNEEIIAGSATATISVGGNPVITMSNEGSSTISLNCGSGVVLGTTQATATELWIVIPPVIFTKGITLKAVDSRGYEFEKTTSNKIIITRNDIQPMAALEAEFVQTKPGYNQIWYTATERVDLYSTTDFEHSVGTNSFDSNTGKGVITFTGKLTRIGDGAFRGKTSLISVTIPDNVTLIGSHAFYGCTSLKEVNLSSSVKTIEYSAFSGCSSLTGISIPEGVTTIEVDAFENTGLTSVTIPTTVTTLSSSGIFNGCDKITEFNGKFATADHKGLVYNNTFIDFAAGSDITEYSLPEGVQYFVGGIFDNGKLTKLVFPSTMVGLSSIAQSNNLKVIQCKSLNPPTIQPSPWSPITSTNGGVYMVPATSVSTYKAANRWSNMSSLIVGYYDDISGVKVSDKKILYEAESKVDLYTLAGFDANFVSNVFDESTKTGVISFDADITKIPYAAFKNTAITNINIPNGVTIICSEAFYNCDKLEGVTFSNTLTELQLEAFYDCDKLTAIALPEGVTTIGSWAFGGCALLERVELPSTITNIGASAFSYSEILDEVICLAEVPPTLGSTVFVNTSQNLVIYVPAESLAAYKVATNWSAYSSNLQASGDVSFEGYRVVLNEEWTGADDKYGWFLDENANLDANQYDGLYTSNNSGDDDSSESTMYIEINGLSSFNFYIKTSSEYDCDFLMVSQLDKAISGSTEETDSGLVKAYKSGISNVDNIYGYTQVQYTDIPEGIHRITIVYKKDASDSKGKDKGYVLIPKEQN